MCCTSVVRAVPRICLDTFVFQWVGCRSLID